MLKRNPGVEELQSGGKYRLVLELDFQDMIPFVLNHIRQRGLMSIIYLVANLVMLAFIPALIIAGRSGLSGPPVTWSVIFRQLVSGIFAGSILIIPLHELIHGLAYKILGSGKIIFGADLQQFIFFVTADRYPVSGIQTCFLALLPFVLINLVFWLITLWLFPGLLLFSCCLLLSHNIMCIGDFAIANYVLRSGNKVYSFDIPEQKKSYFYVCDGD
jgi:hypothetical protein